MPQLDGTTRIKIFWKYVKNNGSSEEAPRIFKMHRATVYRWLKGIRQKGIRRFIREYEQAKKGRRQRKTNPLIKRHIFEIRANYRECCGQKIQFFLQRDYGEDASVSTIYRILHEKYELREKSPRNQKRGMILKGTKPREVIQVDTVDFGAIFAFTAIDTFTREATVILKAFLDGEAGKEAFEEQYKFFGHIEKIQRDGGPEFKKEWMDTVKNKVEKVRTARPYKKNEQAFIERFNGILRKECLGHLHYNILDLPVLEQKLQEFLHYYNHVRPHLSLKMKTPYQTYVAFDMR